MSLRIVPVSLTGLLTLLTVLPLAAAAEKGAAGKPSAAQASGPVSPEQSLGLFVLEPGLRIELVACEPDVIDPVAIRFDEDGRLWVAEYRDYPNGPAAGQPPMSRIRLLEDRDGDGRYETSHVLADELPFVNGIQPWQGGAFVTMQGKVGYIKDTNGDHRADVREDWFTGFYEINPQLFVNHPIFALDNTIHVATGKRGGEARNLKRPGDPPVPVNNRDLRFNPHSAAAEAVSGCGQFGLAFDDYGNRFVCSNRNPLVHAVLAEKYLRRNPYLAVAAVEHDVAAAGDASRVFPLIEAWTTSILHAGQYTAACGIDIYRGDALPAEYYGNGFTCEPTGSLVHREILEPLGGTFTSRPSREGAEFLASRDPWCKPVYVGGGPDGALYVVDMYRKVIEHPQFMPEELKNRPDLRFGEDRGRIYRIVPEDWQRPQTKPRLSQATTADLVALLEHASAWWRHTAQRLLYQRQDQSAAPALNKLARQGRSPMARVHALWTLEGLGLLDDQTLLAALGDAHPRVREQAVVLSEPHLARSRALADRLFSLAADADPRLRFQVALSLGEVSGKDLSGPLAAIALAGADDPWTRRAVATAVPDQAAALLIDVLRRRPPSAGDSGAALRALITELAVLVGARRDSGDVVSVLSALDASSTDEAFVFATVNGLARGLRARGTTLAGLAQGRGPEAAALAGRLEGLFDRAADLAADPKADTALRREACDLLSQAPYPVAAPVLWPLVESEPSQELRLRALAAVAGHADPQVGPTLLAGLAAQTPAVRPAVFDALLSRNDRIALLLDAIEAGQVKARELDSVRATRLLKHRDAAIRQRAEKLMAAAIPADREKVLHDYQAALALKADPRQGKEVFRKNCSTCHKVGDVGVDVGPSIADLRTKTPAQVLLDLLQPNRAIDNNYISYSIATADGNVLTGIIIAETAVSITLRQPEGKNLSVLKSDIDVIQSNGVSLMPEGLERNMTMQDVADVISYLKNWRYLDSDVPAATLPTSGAQ